MLGVGLGSGPFVEGADRDRNDVDRKYGNYLRMFTALFEAGVYRPVDLSNAIKVKRLRNRMIRNWMAGFVV